MKPELEAMKAAGVDIEAVRRGWAFMNSLQETGPEGRRNRLIFLRALAELARKNPAARSIVEALLESVAGELPGEAETFRACYLEGEKQPTPRQAARRLCMDPSTVNRHNKRIFTAMLAPAFGVYGFFRTDLERRMAQEPPESRQETPQASLEGNSSYGNENAVQRP